MVPTAMQANHPEATQRPRELETWVVTLPATFCVVAAALNMWAWFGPPSWRPRIACDPVQFNLGKRHVSETVPAELRISNSGREDLIITGVSTDCSCVTVTQTASTVPPGRSLVVPIRIALANEKNGSLTRHLLITSNDRVTPQVMLTIRANVFGRNEPAVAERR
jgi:hypothetical protein